MAKLFQITCIKHNQYQFNPVTTMYLNPINVVRAPSVDYIDNNGVAQVGTQITYNIAQNNMPHTFVATEPPSTINTRINAANTTDVHTIDVVAIAPEAPATGTINQAYKSARSINVKDIWLVQAHPLNNADALLMLQNQVRTGVTTIRTEQTAANIAAAANA